MAGLSAMPERQAAATGGLEILPVSILSRCAPLVKQFRRLSAELDVELGWHYLLDLAWAGEQLSPRAGMRVLDAGAGTGLMQWWLAERGVEVISVDRQDRRDLPLRFRMRYRVEGLGDGDLAPRSGPGLRDLLPPRSPRRWGGYPRKLAAAARYWQGFRSQEPDTGTVYLYHRELTTMPELPDGSVDAVVSISALEHNSPQVLRRCVGELWRVLKPGGVLVATLAAAKREDWLHAPSRGWCYTEATLSDIFDLPPDRPSNFSRYDEVMDELVRCRELRDNLAGFYFESGDNGMPWGKWDPPYQPVGVVKVKDRE